jgi:integrase
VRSAPNPRRWCSPRNPGNHIEPKNVASQWIAPACDKLGMKRVTWLTFRRTYSSWAHAKGVPGKGIAQVMGHTKVDTTLNIYKQVIDGSVRRAAEVVGAELFTIVQNCSRARGLTSVMTRRSSEHRPVRPLVRN